jgi:hypothetical protein
VRIDQSDVYTCWLLFFTYWRRIGVPFIDQRGLGAVGLHLEGNINFLSVGAPDSPVHHRTLSGARFPSKNGTVDVAVLEPLAHRTLSGAHRTVRCPHMTVGSATRHARIALPTVGSADRWLTGQSGAHRTVW